MNSNCCVTYVINHPSIINRFKSYEQIILSNTSGSRAKLFVAVVKVINKLIINNLSQVCFNDIY